MKALSTWMIVCLIAILIGFLKLITQQNNNADSYTPIIKENEITFSFEDFKERHLKTGVPVIVVASGSPYHNPLNRENDNSKKIRNKKKDKKSMKLHEIPPADMFRDVPENLLKQCGETKVLSLFISFDISISLYVSFSLFCVCVVWFIYQ